MIIVILQNNKLIYLLLHCRNKVAEKLFWPGLLLIKKIIGKPVNQQITEILFG